jgi:aminocarboxymuconate-semialdehyde decarboxylase
VNDPEGLLKEARRGDTDLNAVGVQIFSNVPGRPLDKPETMPLFDLMAELDRSLWLHPARGADFPDYKSKTKSHYEI